MANRTIDAVLRLTNHFTAPANAAIKSMVTMSRTGIMVGKDIQKVGESITKTGKGLTASLTMPIAGAATAAVKTAADFEASMSNVHAIMGATYDDKLKQFAQELGATTAWSAQEVAQAMQYTGMAGWSAQENIQGLKGILDLASASGADLARTSDIVTDAISAFGYTAADSGRFADVMTAACTSANVSVDTLGESYKYVGSLAGSMGYELDQVTTALATMGNQGIKGSEAGTALRTAISNLAAPTKQMREGMEALGISLLNQDGTMKSFEDLIHNIQGSFQGLTADQQAAYAKTIFGKNAMSGMLAIINTSSEAYDSLAASIDASGGAADQAARTQLDNLNGQITLLKSAVEGAAIAFGNKLLPYIKRAAGFAQELMEKINGLSDAQMDNIIKWAGIVAAAGPALMIFGKVVSGVGVVIQTFNKLGVAGKAFLKVTKGAKDGYAAFKSLSTGGKALQGILAGFASPAALVVAAIAAIIGVVLIVRSHMDVFRNSLKALSPVFDSIRGHVQSIIQKFQAIMPAVSPVASFIADVFGTVITAAVGGLVGAIAVAVDTITTVIDSIMTVLQGVIDFVTGVFTGNWELAWSGVAQIFDGIVSGITGTFKGAINGIIGAINGFLGGLNGIKIPDWVPGVGGMAFSMPLIPMLGVGTDNWPGGLAQVHEKGGEIIDLPRGSRVYPHDESVRMARQEGAAKSGGSGGVTIHIANMAVREEADIEKVGDAIFRKIKKASTNRGSWTYAGSMV